MADPVSLVPADPILFFIAWYIRGESSCPSCPSFLQELRLCRGGSVPWEVTGLGLGRC